MSCQSLWGFCDQCELWHFSAHWYLSSTIAKCPECKATTALIEKIEGSETRIALKLELPPEPSCLFSRSPVHLIRSTFAVPPASGFTRCSRVPFIEADATHRTCRRRFL